MYVFPLAAHQQISPLFDSNARYIHSYVKGPPQRQRWQQPAHQLPFKMVSSTDLGPLTASPALPESCMQEYDTIYKIHTTPDGFYWLQGGALETSCFPSGYAALSEQYYSPASCPSGFTAACQSENAIADVTETVQICCPTWAFIPCLVTCPRSFEPRQERPLLVVVPFGFAIRRRVVRWIRELVHSQYDYSCQDTTSYEWEKTLGCVNRQSPSSTTTWTVVTISDGTTATRMSAGLEGGINAYSIQVRFQSSDFASTTSSSTGEVYSLPLRPNVSRYLPLTPSRIV